MPRLIPLLLFCAGTSALGQGPVLLISIDGLRPDYVTQADAHHLRIPNLRRILAEGTHAAGVQGVFPTVTYPSHTTIVTGAWPAVHGILNNQRFDPERKLSGAWYWYAPQIQVPTLWSAAHAAGLSTASVSWPVTADSEAIDFLIPEYWRTASPAEASNPDDRLLIDAISRPSGEVARIAARTGVGYLRGNETDGPADEIRTRYSLDLMARHHPRFMTIHLSSLDEEQHLYGPFSAEADSDLELLDGMVGRLVEQERANDPNPTVAIVSDHGFAAIHTAVNLYVPFVEAGLIETGKSAGGTVEVKSWLAQPWLAGGMAAIMLHDPADQRTREKVHALLARLAADPATGIEDVLDPKQVAALGGFPGAAFVVTLKSGFYTGSALAGPLLIETPGHGTHGYNPATTPEMRASFFIVGPGIVAGRDLGLIDMRQIAPTLARVLQVQLPGAGQPALRLH